MGVGGPDPLKICRREHGFLSLIDNVMHQCSWPHYKRRTINSFMMMMMMVMMRACFDP